MLYLLDANVLITAHNSYYPINRIPEFWSWLRHVSEAGRVKIPREIYEEIREGGQDDEKDLLFAWVKDEENKTAIILDEEPDPTIVSYVINIGYAPDLTDNEVEEMGRDPFLIAYASADQQNRCVVTTEVSRPTRKRQNRKVPDVCESLGVNCCNTFAMLRELGFTTGWKP